MADDFLSDYDVAPADPNKVHLVPEKDGSNPDAPDFEKDFEVAATGKTQAAAPLVEPGALGNKADDGIWAPLKNIATGAIKGLGNSVGFVGNTDNMADYLYARGKAALTGKPIDDIMSEMADTKRKEAANPTTLESISQAIDPGKVFPSGPDVYNPILARTGQFVPTTEGQKLAQSGINAVFSSLGPGVRGAAAPVNALTSGIIRQAPTLAVTGALGQGVTDATGDPLIGMAATAAIPAALRAAGAATNALTGRVDPATAALADTARNQFGIPVGTGEISSNPTVRFMNSVVNKLPGSGGVAHRDDMQTNFNRSVSNTFGEDALRVTPQVMANARDRIGSVFDSVAQRTPVIHADPQLAGELSQTIRDAQSTMTAGEVEPLIRQVQNIAGLVDPQTHTITGEIYQNLTKRGAPLDRAMQSPNPNIANSARDIRESLDDAMERSASPDVINDLRQARSQWRNLRTIEPLVAKAPTGDISPALLQGRVNTNFKGTYGAAYGGGGDLKSLSDIGQRFMKEPPSSGTAERGLMMHLLGGIGTGGAGMMMGEVPLSAAALGVGATAGSALLARGVGAGLRSNALTNSLINRSLGRPNQTPFANYLSGAGLPATVQGNALFRP